MVYFNNHNLDKNNILTKEYIRFVSSYPNKIGGVKEFLCYIEEYKNEKGQLCARLKDKETNKKIVLWTSPLDVYAVEQKRGLLKFLSDTKKMNVLDLFKKDGKDYIVLQALFGEENDNEILVISYFAEFFYSLTIKRSNKE